VYGAVPVFHEGIHGEALARGNNYGCLLDTECGSLCELLRLLLGEGVLSVLN
jgi:hypothetical protein